MNRKSRLVGTRCQTLAHAELRMSRAFGCLLRGSAGASSQEGCDGPVTNVRSVAAHVQRDGDYPVGEGAALQGSRRPRRTLSWHSIAAQVRSAGPARRLPSASSRSLSRANPSPPRLGVHAAYSSARSARRWVAWPVRQLIWLFRRPPIEWGGRRVRWSQRIGHNGFTRRRPRWWHGSATSLVGAPARRGGGP
jgi:hypothetical protein